MSQGPQLQPLLRALIELNIVFLAMAEPTPITSRNRSASFYVYLHRRATDGRVFYVGKGKGKRAYKLSSRNDYWQRTVAKHGFTVEFVVRDVQEWYAMEVEREQIAYYGRDQLCNLTDGGEGAAGLHVSPETRALKADMQRGKRHDAEMRKKISDGLRRYLESRTEPIRLSDEHRKRVSEGVRRTMDQRPPVSDSARLNMSRAALGKVISPEQRAKLSVSMRAANGTPEKRHEASLRMKAIRARQRAERAAATAQLF